MLPLRSRALALCLVCIALGCWPMPSVPLPEPPTYVCRQASDSISVDGFLDERSWQLAQPMRLVLREDASTPQHATAAKAVWDETALYVAFVCQDPEIWATMRERDDRLWSQEVVEVFLDPNGNGDPYFEFEVNPLNVVVDLRLMRSLRDKGMPLARVVAWDCEAMQTAVRVKGQVSTWQTAQRPGGEWTVEMAIPFAALDSLPSSPPKDGDAWKANFYRIDRPGHLAQEEHEFTCWSPIISSKSFHTLDRFGTLVFSSEKVTPAK